MCSSRFTKSLNFCHLCGCVGVLFFFFDEHVLDAMLLPSAKSGYLGGGNGAGSPSCRLLLVGRVRPMFTFCCGCDVFSFLDLQHDGPIIYFPFGKISWLEILLIPFVFLMSLESFFVLLFHSTSVVLTRLVIQSEPEVRLVFPSGLSCFGNALVVSVLTQFFVTCSRKKKSTFAKCVSGSGVLCTVSVIMRTSRASRLLRSKNNVLGILRDLLVLFVVVFWQKLCHQCVLVWRLKNVFHQRLFGERFLSSTSVD